MPHSQLSAPIVGRRSCFPARYRRDRRGSHLQIQKRSHPNSKQFNERSDLFIISHGHTSVITQKQLQEWEHRHFTADIQAWSQARGQGWLEGLLNTQTADYLWALSLFFSIRHNFCLEPGLCVLAGSVVWHMVRLICQRLLALWYRTLSAPFSNVLCINTLCYKHTSPPTSGVWMSPVLSQREEE